MKKLFLLSLVMTMLFSMTAFTQTSKSWTGATSTAWNTAGNWNPSGVPNATHNVFIPSAPANQPVISGTTTPVCNNLTVYSGAMLTISGTSTANAQLTVVGTATFNGQLSIGGFLSRTGKLVATNVIWNSTSSISPFLGGRIELSGNWTFSSGSSIIMGNCWVTFTGTGNSLIYTYSADSKFGSVGFSKTTTASTSIATGSNATLTFGSGFSIDANNTFTGGVNITTVVQGNIVANGRLNFYTGTMRLERASGIQSIQMAGTNNRVNNLVINCGGTVTLDNQFEIQGSLTIQAGTLNPQNNTLYVSGNWSNLAGPDFFTEGTGKVVMNLIINKTERGSFDQYINYSENFNILEINNAYGDVIINSSSAVVTCNQYDWTNGGIKVQAGTFTASDLIDNGIFGRYTLQTGGTINLTNNDGYVDLNGATITITGGVFNVYGGTTESYWPFGGASSITMSGGVLNFTQGIRVQSSPALTYSITGGTIKTARSFTSNKSNFNPTGGTVELYGNTDASLYLVSGSTLYSVNINKGASAKETNDELRGIVMIDRETGKPIEDESSRANTVNLTNPATFEGNFTLSAGTFNSNSHTIQAKRNWTNNAGAGSFVPGTGRVIFNGGNYHQYCYNETFNILELAKASGGSFRLSSGTTVTCAVYDWTAGSIDVLTNGGTFTALDLFDNGIFGGYYVNPGGTINLYQNAAQWIDLCGNITFTGGGTINVYGGSSTSYWPYNNNASITMNAGVLDFKDHGILVTTSAHTLTTNITGGTIRTAGTFACSRADFNPIGGAIELYGAQNANLSMSAGTLYNLTVNKSAANSVSLTTNATLTGGLTVNSGTMNMNAKTMITGQPGAVNNGGILHLNAGSSLLIASTNWLNVNSGGLLKVIGAAGNPALISRNGASDYINININDGGNISARNARFHYVDALRILPYGIIDPDNPLDDCQFRYSANRMLWVENGQTLLIRNAEFLTPATGYNVYKSINSGELIFKDATGNYSGEAYENDPYNLIHWTTTQPGLWTGAISTNWHAAGNWDDGVVPTSTVDVTIPASAPNMPVLSANGYCKNMVLNGIITLSANCGLFVTGNLDIHGRMNNTGFNSHVTVTGNVTCHEGMYSQMPGNFNVYGDWTFAPSSETIMQTGTVTFLGSANSNLFVYSPLGYFNNVKVAKNTGLKLIFHPSSYAFLGIHGDLEIQAGTAFQADADMGARLKGNIINNGNFWCNDGYVIFSSEAATQEVQVNPGDYLNLVYINSMGTVSINNHLTVNYDLEIQNGSFNANGNNIYIKGSWRNYAAPGSFIPGNGRVIFNGGNSNQYVVNETFNTLELNKSAPGSAALVVVGNVTCTKYDWTAGRILVDEDANFTAQQLLDNAIMGGFIVPAGGTVNLSNPGGFVDLNNATIDISGGTFNVYGGNDYSFWSYINPSTLTMSAGTFNFEGPGIYVNSFTALTSNITGGTIKTTGQFKSDRTDFNPSGGTLELYGSDNSQLRMEAGTLYDLTINKNGSAGLYTNVTVNGSLEVNSGTFNVFGTTLTLKQHSQVINTSSVIKLYPNSTVRIASSKVLNVGAGATLQSLGTAGNEVLFRNDGVGYYMIFVNEDGAISAEHTRFHYVNPLTVMPGATVDPEYPLSNCQFRYAATGSLAINNNQNLMVLNAEFLKPNAGYNVSKTVNTGSVTFRDAFGDHAGPSFEQDPNNRIHWTTTQPGLWTGAVSTNWHTAGNWDDGLVPTSTVDVTIPPSAPYMPLISTHANCKNLTMNGTLTINDPTLTVSGNAVITGHLTMNYELARFVVMGDLTWQSGSTASQNNNDNEIQVFGNFTFNAGSNVQLNNGGVIFMGTTNKNLINHSSASSFYNLVCRKTSGAAIDFASSSTEPLRVTGSLSTETGAKFTSSSGLNIEIVHNLVSYGTFELEWPRLVFNGVDQYIQPNVNDYFYTIDFNQSGTVTINSSNSNVLQVRGGVAILSGVFNAGSSTIKVRSGWVNEVGPGAFIAGNSRVIFEGFLESTIYDDENFNILEINKTSGALVVNGVNLTCNSFDWTNGPVKLANGGVFTAYDLADDGIFADIELQSGSTVNLYQDIYQRVDLGGKLWIMGGSTVNVYGGNGWSQWPYGADATLYMTDGTLDFKDQGVNVNSISPNTLMIDITGGTIRTSQGFFCNRADFTPAAGTLELYGGNDADLTMEAGNLQGLTINKSVGSIVNLNSSGTTTILGTTTVESGTFKILPGKEVISDHIYVMPDGTLWLTENSLLKVTPSRELRVDGGMLKVHGTPSNHAMITRWFDVGEINMLVDNGGTISASNAHFSGMLQGVRIASSGLVDPDNAFTNCTFEDSFSDGLLVIDNNQDLIIYDAHFPTASAPYNVQKNSNSGSITFIDATGAFSGESFEDDPHNRIHWVTPVPGLWTGAVSTDWFTAGNWSDGNIPTDDISVVIPADRMFMPVISGAQAFCHNLEVFGTLTINNNSLQAGGNADFHGILAMNNWQAFLTVLDNITWHSGSSANITANANIRVYGNWSFLEGATAQLENGAVLFAGTTPSTILCNSEASWFNHVEIEKSAMNFTYLDESSLHPLRTNNLYVFATAGFASDGGQDIIARGNVGSYGVMTMEGGSLILTGVNPIIAQNTGNYFHNLHFSQTGTATINTVNTNMVNIKNDLVIISGVFEAGGCTINLGGDWDNQTAAAAFDKGTSRVVFNGTKTQFCSSENFHILEVDNPVDLLYNQAYSTITCDIYDWTNGGLWISPGNFTAAALADDGLFGTYAIFGGTMELYQDISKSVSLVGELFIGNNATLNVYGGNGVSYWGQSGDASVTMGYVTGVLDFKNSGINIADQTPYQFTGNITAGTIKTAGSFFATSPGFNPTGGNVELYGELGATVLTEPGSSFWNLLINKPVTFNPRVSMYSTKVTNDLVVEQGLCELFSAYTFEIGNIIVQDGGWLANNGATVHMSGLVVNSGGYLTNEGFEDVICVYTSLNPGEKYSFTLQSGSNMLVFGTLFENMDENGIYIAAGAEVTNYEPFINCEFRNGAAGPYPLLVIENDQDLTIENAVFPTNTWGGQYNVRKSIDQGSITFINPTGDFAGEAYEDDPHNRIHWVTSVPGLWTGAVSTDWFTAGNWSDGNVPTEETNVLIPADRMFMPVISSGTAYCNDLTLNGTLTLGGANLDIKGNLEVNGHFETTLGGDINIGGDVEWNQGSTASIHLFTSFYIYGNWRFNAGADVQITGGTVFLIGNATKTLINHSPESQFNALFIYKSGGAFVEIPGESDQPIHLNGVLRIDVGSQLIINSDQELSIGAHFYNDGNLHCNFGTIRFTGFNINISCSPDDIFNNVIFDHTETATLMENFSEFNLHGDLTFNSGVFNPGDNTIKLWGSWINNAGPGAFNKAQSRVIFTGTNGQFCSSEDFNILEIDKALQYLYLQNEDVVTCNSYDWTNGGLWIAGNATFIANDLADNGIYGFLHLFDGYVELHQDDQQSVDLRGELIVSGGEMKVFGGNDLSRWGMYADAQLTMSGGVLDFGEIGINVAEDFGFNFSSNITGGVIRTMGIFWAQSEGFNPSGGIVELYGDQIATVLTEPGTSFWNLHINKPEDYTSRVSMYQTTITNELVVANGLCEFYPTYESAIGNITIQDGGWLANGGATVHMSGLVVNAGGELSSQGYDDVRSVYTSLNPGEKYSFTVESGGNIYVDNTLFEHMDENGIYIAAGATVNNYLPFINSEFRNGAAGPYPLLVIDTDQDLIIENAVFPTNTWGGQYNVRKSVDQGSVTFVNYSGDFGGSAFEDDPYNRINWQSFVPGLWTGLVSSDWNTPGNWGNMQVPDEFTDATIPADAPNMPVVNSPDAICYSITIDAGADLTIGSGKLFMNNIFKIYGNLTMTNPTAEIEAFGIYWEAGSTDNITSGNIKVKYWFFYEGTMAKLGPGNTATVTKGISAEDLEAEFGSLVISTSGKSPEQRTLFALRVSGDCLMKTGSNWFTTMDIIIAGNFTVEMGSGFRVNTGEVKITVGGNLYLGGYLRDFNEIIVDGNFDLQPTGELKLTGGTFICNYETEDWIELNGKLIMTNFAFFNLNEANVRIGSTFDSQEMLLGTFSVGKSFEAIHPNSFQPGNIWINFINTYSGHSINVSNGNYLPSVYIERTGCELTLAADLLIDGHVHFYSGTLITAGNKLTVTDDFAIRYASRLTLSPGTELTLGGIMELIDGGTLETVGLADNYNVVNCIGTTAIPSINFNISAITGGSISAAYTHFMLNNKPNGILIESTGLVDLTNSFHYCSFATETMEITLFTIDNNQDLVINRAQFPDYASGGFNAAKLTPVGSVTFNNATGDFAGSLYENDPFNRIHWETTLFSQPISIPAGWSGISSYILPSQPALEDVFAPISNELIIAQTMTAMYYPGENINQIGNWISHSAYKVKTNAACLLTIEGEQETNLAVQLNAGWNLLPVVTPDGADPVNLFMPVNGFVIVKDVAGTGVFWPQYNINSIGYIFPGKAYYVLMTAPGVVDYTGMKSSQNLPGFLPKASLGKNLEGLNKTLSGLGIKPTPYSHTIAILPDALKDIEIGTIIGAFDQTGNCFGVTIISESANHLTIFGDDPTTIEKDGFFEEEVIFFKNLSGFRTLSGLEPTFDQNLPQSNGLFTENGLSAITGFKEATGIGYEGFGSSVSIYPNPSNGVVIISGLVDETIITVIDVHGQVILETETINSGLFFLDLSGSNPGVYFVNIHSNMQSVFRKIVLR